MSLDRSELCRRNLDEGPIRERRESVAVVGVSYGYVVRELPESEVIELLH